jgi:hypothetical protein
MITSYDIGESSEPNIRIDGATSADRDPDWAYSVDSARELDKIGTVGSTYFSEIEKVRSNKAGPAGGVGRGS